jgi:hypothetical protein
VSYCFFLVYEKCKELTQSVQRQPTEWTAGVRVPVRTSLFSSP